jgi:hypothetical protein
MGTWGIAKDMAKINEENLSKLSRKGMFQKLKDYGSSSSKRIYTFKKSTPELLKEIRETRAAENLQAQKRRILLGSICIVVAVLLFWVVLYV